MIREKRCFASVNVVMEINQPTTAHIIVHIYMEIHV